MEENKQTSPAEEQACTTELVACQEKLAKSAERLAYLTADFENFRRRTEKDRAQWSQAAQVAVLMDVVAIFDDFERAFTDLTKQQLPAELKSYFAGFELIYKAFLKLLTKYGIEEISAMSLFDPEYHEAVMQVANSDKEPGSIVAVLQKGYTYKGSVLRPAKVSVAQ